MTAEIPLPNLCGWLALLTALSIINEHDPELKRHDLNTDALNRYVAPCRDRLVHHYSKQITPSVHASL